MNESPLDLAILPFRRYADFSGRSRRAEYWWFTLLILVGGLILALAGYLAGMDFSPLLDESSELAFSQVFPNATAIAVAVVAILGFVLILVPSIALAIRRLHDLGLSGWFYLAYIIAGELPVVGRLVEIVYFVGMCRRGTKGPNKYGPDPLGHYDIDVFG